MDEKDRAQDEGNWQQQLYRKIDGGLEGRDHDERNTMTEETYVNYLRKY